MPTGLATRVLPLPLVLLATACSHTEAPSLSAPGLTEEPFSGSIPIRLSYSGSSNRNPGWSADGVAITYSYETNRSDGDVCIGILPASGGQRRFEQCGSGVDEGQWTDGGGASTVSPAGLLLWTSHRSAPAEPGFRQAQLLQVDPAAAASTPSAVFSLGGRLSGAAERWDDLLDPIWLDNGDLLIIGAQWFRIPQCSGNCPADKPRYDGPDTLRLGVEIARISGLDGGSVGISSLTTRPGILSMAMNRNNGELLFLQQFSSPGDNTFFEPMADTIYRMPVAGGIPVPTAGTPRAGAPYLERFHALATAGGKTFIARSWYDDTLPAAGVLAGDISELNSDGTLTPRWPAPGGSRWTRLAAAPDGSALLAELATGSSHDIYLIPLR